MIYLGQQCVAIMLILVWSSDWTLGQTVAYNQCELKRHACDICGQPVFVTLIARNVLQSPTFEIRISLKLRQGSLLNVLEEAAELDNGFRFKVTYSPNVGYFIHDINLIESIAENGTFWHLISMKSGALNCGVSKYIPSDGEIILLNFTTYNAVGYIS